MLLSLLQAHEPGYRLSTHLSARVLRAEGGADRDAVMGRPIRYARLEIEGLSAGEDRSLSGAYALPRLHLGLMVWRALDEDAEADGGSAALFEQTVYGDAPPGLVPYLAGPGASLVLPGGAVALSIDLRDVSTAVVQMAPGPGGLAHYAEMLLVLS